MSPWLFILVTGYSLASCLFLLASVRRRYVSRATFWRGDEVAYSDGRCGRCRYDLSGLPYGAHCPECGASPLLQRRRVLAVHPFRLRQWRFTLIGFVLALLVRQPLAYLHLRLAYHIEGFSLEQTLRAIPVRARNGIEGPGPEAWPFFAAVALAPLAIWFLAPRRLKSGITALWLVGLLAAIGTAIWTA
ncbi:hypothetical protein PHYC_01472 [Phycisphaerales bacterium]|nr:hypothetical protein PHYC_01472 [Phycisphaerales bacterium]